MCCGLRGFSGINYCTSLPQRDTHTSNTGFDALRLMRYVCKVFICFFIRVANVNLFQYASQEVKKIFRATISVYLRYKRMKKLAILLPLLSSVLINKPPGKFVKMDKVDDDFYVVLRETVDSSQKYPMRRYKLCFEHAYWGEDNYSSYYIYDMDSIMDEARRKYCLKDGDTLTDLNSSFFNYGGVPQIEFVSRELGFMYGTSMVYAYYPFVYRTADGGHTWTFYTSKELAEARGIMGMPLEHFHMFDDKHGIILWSWDAVSQHYSLTSDGGVTWNHHSFLLPSVGKCVQLEHVTFTGVSNVTLVYVVSDCKDSKSSDTRIMKSENYGKSFRRLD